MSSQNLEVNEFQVTSESVTSQEKVTEQVEVTSQEKVTEQVKVTSQEKVTDKKEATYIGSLVWEWLSKENVTNSWYGRRE